MRRPGRTLRWLPLMALAILSLSMLTGTLRFAHGFESSQSAALAIGEPDLGSSVNPSNAFKVPSNFVFDSSGNIWVSDSGNNRILEEPAPGSGVETPKLVLGQQGLTTSLPATSSLGIDNPSGLTFDSTGNLWFADTSNNRVLEYPKPFTTGEAATTVIGQLIFTSASSAVSPYGLDIPATVLFDSSGNLWVVDGGNNRIVEYLAPLSSGMAASLVLGQSSLTADLAGTAANGLHYPTWATFDSSGDVWVADSGNNRVLEYKAPFSTGMNASLVIGQSSLTTGTAATTNSGLDFPDGLAFDSSGDLWVADALNDRVVEFAAPLSTGMQASAVLGQPGFTTGAAATSQTGMDNPSQVSFGPGGNLWVADSYNHRLLQFAPPFATGSAANAVLGQSGFFSNVFDGKVALDVPESVSFDSSGNLWAADTNDNRVVEYYSPFSTGESASLVLGQTNLNRSLSSTTAAGLSSPFYTTFDSSGDLWVSDSGNNRVLEYTAPFSNGMNASLVLGQATFGTSTAQAGGSGMDYPAGLAFDSSGNLWVADTFNNRILEFRAPFSSGMQASLVIGQLAFSGSSPGVSATQFYYPVDIAFDSGGDLWVADAANSRILEFVPPFTTGEAASLVIGQPNLNSGTPGLSQYGLYIPSSVGFDHSGNLWVGDQANNRLVEFARPFTGSMSASLVIGQPGFSSNAATTMATGLASPLGIAFDNAGNLWVADSGNNRLLEFQFGATSSSTSTSTATSSTTTTSSTGAQSSTSGVVTLSVTTPSTTTTTSSATSTTTSSGSTTSSKTTTSAVPEFPLGVSLALASALLFAVGAASALRRSRPR